MIAHDSAIPSPWVARWAAALAPAAKVLDVACGTGRHARFLAARGAHVVGVDRDRAALATLAYVEGVQTIEADIEAGDWPFSGAQFDAVIVTNYLHRPLFSRLGQAVAPGGRLIYETFMRGNERYGRPANPAFLLAPDELLHAFAADLAVVAFEQGMITIPKTAVIQRLVAHRPAGDTSELVAL